MNTLVLLALISFPFSLSRPAYRENRAGNEKMKAAKEAEALPHYDRALRASPFSDAVRLNRGSALLGGGRGEEAVAEFQRALGGKDEQLRSAAAYDLGNALVKTGKIPEALAAYKRALDLDPGDRDAKYNLEFLQRMMQKQKQQSKDQKDQKDQKDPNQKDQQKSGEDQKENQDPAKQKREEEQEKNEDKESGGEKEKQNVKDESGEAKPAKLTKAEAERILDAVKEDERDLVKARMKARKRRDTGGKDW